MDAAGWTAGSDGIRAKNGRKLEIGYTLIGSDPLDKALAQAFAAMLKQVGVKVDIRTVDESDFSKVLSTRDFDLFLSGNRSLDPFGQRYLCQEYCSTSASNLTGTGTAELDQQIKAVSQIADLDQQIAAANKVEQQELQQYAFLPLFSGPSIYAVKDGLANVGATIFGTPLPETIGWQS
ncbi:ABC transporter substrate-binding protein [Streptacidiphilus monticola]